MESEWAEFKFTLVSNGTDHNSRFQLTTTDNGIVWFDQISVMPDDTYNVHDHVFIFYFYQMK